MQQALLIIQIITGILLSGAILLQVKGNGFGRAWGSLNTSSSKRGIEGLVFKLTFTLLFIFTAAATVSLLV